MRNMNLEAAIWNLFTSTEFYEAAGRECDNMLAWFGSRAVSNNTGGYGRNGQIYDTFKALARDFRRGGEMAKLDDYILVWDTARCFRGDVRGMMEQPIRSWMSDAEYEEFGGTRISRILSYATQVTRALNNAMTGADSFFDPDPDWPEGSDDDDGFPGDGIVKTYDSETDWYKDQLHWALPIRCPNT